MIPLTGGTQSSHIHRRKVERWWPRGCEERTHGDFMFNRDRDSEKMQRSWRQMVVVTAAQQRVLNAYSYDGKFYVILFFQVNFMCTFFHNEKKTSSPPPK